MRSLYDSDKWLNSKADVFWGELAPCDHVLQIYETDTEFINILSGFCETGIRSNEGVIVIATEQHRKAVEANLLQTGLNMNEYSNKNYFAIDAQEMLSSFMVNGWPDEKKFLDVVANLVKKARINNRKVRAFGEMVALLWAQGQNGATVQLEHLWNQFCKTEVFCLFCAYPKSGSTTDMHSSVNEICSVHSKIVTSAPNNGSIRYMRTSRPI